MAHEKGMDRGDWAKLLMDEAMKIELGDYTLLKGRDKRWRIYHNTGLGPVPVAPRGFKYVEEAYQRLCEERVG